MGSQVEVLAWGGDGERCLDAAVAEVERYEQCWSRFRPDSELSQLNRSAGTAFTCSFLLWDALSRAASAWHETGGIYDPTVLPTLTALGYDTTFRQITPDPGRFDAEAVPLPVGFGAVELDPPNRRVVLPPGAALDLGGVGKGLAADLLVSHLQAYGATSVLVSAGGDLRVTGPGPDEDDAWMIDIENPLDGSVLLRFPLVDEALVQSTTRFRTWRRGGTTMHHLIDPRTGRPAASGIASVIVTGRQAWRAEVMAKAALIAGEHDGLALLARTGHDGWLLRDDGTIVPTAAVAADVPRRPGRTLPDPSGMLRSGTEGTDAR
jgi:thiamine biosynthesis lipoprotein